MPFVQVKEARTPHTSQSGSAFGGARADAAENSRADATAAEAALLLREGGVGRGERRYSATAAATCTTFAASSGSVLCTLCPTGKYSNRVATDTECDTCDAGKYTGDWSSWRGGNERRHWRLRDAALFL